MNYHEFTLESRGFPGRSGTEHADALFEAGCDDGSVMTRDEEVVIKFTRQAPSLEAAIVSAVEQLNAAGYAIIRVNKELESGAI